MPLTPAERNQRIERYARGPALLRAAFERVPQEARKWRSGAEDWLDIYAEHLEKHSLQIDKNLAAWREARGAKQ